MNTFQDNQAVSFLTQKGVMISGQKSVLRSSNFFFAKNVDGAGGHFPILRQSDQFLEGVRNIDKAELPAGEHLALRGIQVRVAADVTTDEASSTYKSVSTGATGELLNSILQLKVGGEVIVEEKVEDLLAEAATEGLGGNIYFGFDNWKYVPGGRVIDAQLIVPEGKTISVTNNLHLKVKLVGTAAKLR